MRYTEEHEWLRPEEDEDDVVTIGLTELAVSKLGEMLFVDLPKEGQVVVREDEVAVLEGAEATTEILSALDGEVVEVNEALEDDPGLVNEDPLGKGWIFRMRVADMGDYESLMDEMAYKAFL